MPNFVINFHSKVTSGAGAPNETGVGLGNRKLSYRRETAKKAPDIVYVADEVVF